MINVVIIILGIVLVLGIIAYLLYARFYKKETTCECGAKHLNSKGLLNAYHKKYGECSCKNKKEPKS